MKNYKYIKSKKKNNKHLIYAKKVLKNALTYRNEERKFLKWTNKKLW